MQKKGGVFLRAVKIFQIGRMIRLRCKNPKLSNLVFFKQAGQNEYRR
jgi:hypothetical protein